MIKKFVVIAFFIVLLIIARVHAGPQVYEVTGKQDAIYLVNINHEHRIPIESPKITCSNNVTYNVSPEFYRSVHVGDEIWHEGCIFGERFFKEEKLNV